MKGKRISIMCLNIFRFGDQKVSQFVIFECKWLFSIIFFYFHKTDKTQDRFHTHAFNAVSFKLFGTYDEYLYNETDKSVTVEPRTRFFKYFPRDCFHKIGNSKGCCTLLLAGPWKETWKEVMDDGTTKTYNWNRK